MSNLKLLSWNVNGIRAAHKKGFMEFLAQHDPDVLCLQEIKAKENQIPDEILENGQHYSVFHPAERPGYSGTAILTKHQPINVERGMGIDEHHGEGIVMTAEFPNHYLVNVYTPNSKRDLSRLEYRQKWDQDFLDYLKDLEKHKPVIFCGDLNVAHNEIDLKNPTQNRRNAGFTDEERQGIDRAFSSGFVDTFRHFEKGPNHYSWWSYMGRSRERNVGWRIDYFGVSEKLVSNLAKAFILPEVFGSDHCPVGIEYNTSL